MPRNSTQTSLTAPLGSTGMTPHPAHIQPPRVQTSPNPHSPIPEVSIPVPASTAVPQEGISRPLANTGKDLVDHGLVNRLLALQPNMTLDQMTSVLNILHPNRHRNAAAAALRRAPPCTDPIPYPSGCACPHHRPHCPTPHRHPNQQPPEEITTGQPSTRAREHLGDFERTISHKVHPPLLHVSSL